MYACLIFHSFGTIQSKAFEPDLVFLILNLVNSDLIIFKVSRVPFPVILLLR